MFNDIWHVCVHTYTCKYIHINIYICIYTYTYMHIYTRVCAMHVYVHVCVYMCVYILHTCCAAYMTTKDSWLDFGKMCPASGSVCLTFCLVPFSDHAFNRIRAGKCVSCSVDPTSRWDSINAGISFFLTTSHQLESYKNTINCRV